jgi:hypothetical protein
MTHHCPTCAHAFQGGEDCHHPGESRDGTSVTDWFGEHNRSGWVDPDAPGCPGWLALGKTYELSTECVETGERVTDINISFGMGNHKMTKISAEELKAGVFRFPRDEGE